MKIITEYKDQDYNCDYCNENATVHVRTDEENYDWYISCKKHEKDARESLDENNPKEKESKTQ